MTPEELAKAIINAVEVLRDNGDPDSVCTLERIFNLLEDDQRV